MERIKQALDRAREERKNDQKTTTPATSSRAGEAALGQTRTVEVNSSLLRKNCIMTEFGRNAFTDAYKILRTQILQHLNENNWNTFAVTSPGAGEGKTLTAINLAASLAMELDYTVLLVEANLLHPNMHEFFGLTPQKGLSDYLLGEADVPELLIQPSSIDHLGVLLGGRALANSAEMLNSSRMGQLVEELKTRYPNRIVIFDLPPVLDAADTVAFTPLADATLLVIEEGKTKEPELVQAVKLLERTTIIGTVLNKMPTKA